MAELNSKFSFQKLLFGNKSLCEGKLASVALRVTDIAGRVTGFNKFYGFQFHEALSLKRLTQTYRITALNGKATSLQNNYEVSK